MTDPRVEAAFEAAWNVPCLLGDPIACHNLDDVCIYETQQENIAAMKAVIRKLVTAALAAADAAAWRPITEYRLNMGQVHCGHSEKKWLRHGRMIPGHGSRWYYSGTNERSQWAQQEGDKPTHFRPLPAPPVNSDALGGRDG